MSQENITENIINKIKKEHLKPRAKWKFLMAEYSIWIFFTLSIIIGSLATAATVFMVENSDWDLYRVVSDSFLGFLLIMLPYFWIVVLALFIYIAYFNFRHTKCGYKYSFPLVTVSTIILSIMIGILFYNIGLGEAIESQLQSKVPFYNKLHEHRLNIWQQPDRGVLVGRIINIGDENIEITDIQDRYWIVIYDRSTLRGFMKFETNMPIKVIGNQIDDEYFEAFEIRPFHPRMMPGMPLGSPSGGHVKGKMKPLRSTR